MTYPDPASKSARLYARARAVLPDGGSRSTIRLAPHGIYIESAAGKTVTDVDGVTRIDFNNNYTSLIHGHAHPAIVQAAEQQLRKASAFSFGSEAEIRLAELLCDRVAAFARVRFMNSGTEAVMNAVKVARAATGRAKIAKCDLSYHGSYDPVEASMAPPGEGEALGEARPYTRGTPTGVLDDVVILPFNDAEGTRRILRAHGNTLAAIVFDPFGQFFGSVAPTNEFIEVLLEARRDHGVLLVADEVVAFRASYEGCFARFGAKADLTALGKVIGGGFPVGAVAGSAELMRMFEVDGVRAPVPHGGTFNANPVTMAAGRAAMDMMTVAEFERINALGESFRRALRDVLDTLNLPGQVRGQASVFSIALETDEKSSDPQEVVGLRRYLLNNGYFIGNGLNGCVSTPMTEADVAPFCETVAAGLKGL